MNETVTVKRWHACVMLGLSGFAIGNVLAKLTTAMGF